MTSAGTESANEGRGHMTARDVKRSALGMGRILLGVIMAIVGPMWLVSALVDYTRPTVPTNNLVAPSVEVHDETGSFEPIVGRPLTDALGDVKFTRPIHLVILSTDDLVDDNLDEATLKYARARHQEWISPNGYKWADGYLILSLSPTHRKVGTYFGEDIAPLLFVQEEIQDAAKDDFRAGRWSQGMVAAATKAAAYIPNEAGYSIKNRVVWPHWMGWLVSLTGIGVLLRGHSLRRTVRESSERIAAAWEETEGASLGGGTCFPLYRRCGALQQGADRALRVRSPGAQEGARARRRFEVPGVLRISQRRCGERARGTARRYRAAVGRR